MGSVMMVWLLYEQERKGVVEKKEKRNKEDTRKKDVLWRIEQ